MNYGDVIKYLENTPRTSKVYIGTDSYRYPVIDKKTRVKTWWAAFTTVVVIHIEGNKGCKVFGNTIHERDYTDKPNRPKYRMIRETGLSAECYVELAPYFEKFESKVEIHCDINTNEAHGSSCAVKEAVGFIRGTCGIEPKFKPYAWAASGCADHFVFN